MAARLDAARRDRVAQQGFGMISTDRGLSALVRAMSMREAQLTIMPVDWRRVLEAYPDGMAPPLLRDLDPIVRRDVRPGAAGTPTIRLADRLSHTPASEWRDVVTAFVREQLAKVLALQSGDAVGEHTPLTEVGLDSLMAIELRNGLGAAVGKTLPASLVYDHPTIDALSAYLLEVVSPAAVTEPAPPVPYKSVLETATAEAGAAAIEGLTQEQLAALLADRLAAIGNELS